MTMTVPRLDRAPGIADPGRVPGAGTGRPDPEVPERARRRTFTARYKLEILAAYDAAPDGEKGALLRREGLYSSHIVEWRRARDAGALAGLARPRGRPQRDAREDRIARWSRRNASWSRSWLSPLRGEGASKTAREPNPRAGRYKLAPASRPPSSRATGQTALITRRPKNHGGNMLSDSPNTRTFSLMHVPRSRRTRCPGRY
jgi:hypothetical protein